MSITMKFRLQTSPFLRVDYKLQFHLNRISITSYFNYNFIDLAVIGYNVTIIISITISCRLQLRLNAL